MAWNMCGHQNHEQGKDKFEQIYESSMLFLDIPDKYPEFKITGNNCKITLGDVTDTFVDIFSTGAYVNTVNVTKSMRKESYEDDVTIAESYSVITSDQCQKRVFFEKAKKFGEDSYEKSGKREDIYGATMDICKSLSPPVFENILAKNKDICDLSIKDILKAPDASPILLMTEDNETLIRYGGISSYVDIVLDKDEYAQRVIVETKTLKCDVHSDKATWDLEETLKAAKKLFSQESLHKVGGILIILSADKHEYKYKQNGINIEQN
jgi:hypothetical protein